MKPAIHPSLLNCDLLDLAGQVNSVRNADMAHVDVMDNHFVPNLSWGIPIAEAVARQATLPVDAHLMINDPDRWAPAYAEVGCASVTFHLEAAAAPVRLSRELHRLGARVGLALKPATPFAACVPVLPEIDMLLIMTVEPGFGGQSFLSDMLPKISEARKYFSQANLQIGIQVDGGVDRDKIAEAAEAGADIFVAGTAIFRADDAFQEVAALREIAQAHCH